MDHINKTVSFPIHHYDIYENKLQHIFFWIILSPFKNNIHLILEVRKEQNKYNFFLHTQTYTYELHVLASRFQ